MQLRVRGSSVTIIRNVYDPDLKRGRVETIGTIPLTSMNVPRELYAKLAPDEIMEVEELLDAMAENREVAELEELANSAPGIVKQIADALSMCSISSEQVEELKAGINRLERVLDRFSKS